MFNLQPPRHISTLPKATVSDRGATCRDGPILLKNSLVETVKAH